MELRRNLLKISEPSRFRIILGIGSIIFSGLWIIVRAYEDSNIPWSDIQSIEYNTMSFRIKRLNEKEQILNLPRMDYTLIQEIKKVIGSIAEDKF